MRNFYEKLVNSFYFSTFFSAKLLSISEIPSIFVQLCMYSAAITSVIAVKLIVFSFSFFCLCKHCIFAHRNHKLFSHNYKECRILQEQTQIFIHMTISYCYVTLISVSKIISLFLIFLLENNIFSGTLKIYALFYLIIQFQRNTFT